LVFNIGDKFVECLLGRDIPMAKEIMLNVESEPFEDQGSLVVGLGCCS